MAESALYDLLLLLSNDAPEEQRARVLSLVESSITGSGGSIERDDDWGRRPMAYQIRHQAESEYHLLQFRAPGSIIEELSHTLRITDGVLRVRIIKVRPGTPEAKSSPPPVVAAVAASSQGASASSAEAAARRNDRAAQTESAEAPEEPSEEPGDGAGEPEAPELIPQNSTASE